MSTKNPLGFLLNMLSKGLNLLFQTTVRTLGVPFQRFIDRAGDTHSFLTEQSITILARDGYLDAAHFFSDFKDSLTEGNIWADCLWKNAFHHYNPRSQKGLLTFHKGTDECGKWFQAALTQWKKGKIEKSMFYLGAALHIVQDLCQPYHSNCKILGGHQRYEAWADGKKHLFKVENGGLYRMASNPKEWAFINAQFSHDYLPWVTQKEDHPSKTESTRVLIERAQMTSAGFLMFFLEEARNLHSIYDPDPEFFRRVLSPLAAD